MEEGKEKQNSACRPTDCRPFAKVYPSKLLLSLCKITADSVSFNQQHRIAQNAVRGNDGNHNTNPFTHTVGRVIIRFQHRGASDLAFRLQVGGVHAVILWRGGGGVGGEVAVVVPVCELIDLWVFC